MIFVFFFLIQQSGVTLGVSMVLYGARMVPYSVSLVPLSARMVVHYFVINFHI